jgi:iron-sulfur cluster assembly protein
MVNESLSPSVFPITITDRALAQIRRLIAKDADPAAFLRLGVKGGGCSGLEYLMKIDKAVRATDLTLELDGVRIVCDPKSAKLLDGSTFDYTGNLIGGGFKFENPNAVRTCGCGTSFTPKAKAV